MDVTVTLRGPSYGPFGKPTTITVDVRGVSGRHAMPSDVKKVVEATVAECVAAYIGMVEADREPEPAPLEGMAVAPTLDPQDLEAIREPAEGQEALQQTAWDGQGSALKDPPEVPTMPDPTPPPVPLLPKMRCGQIGEHDPHTWTGPGIRPYRCEGEVF